MPLENCGKRLGGIIQGKLTKLRGSARNGGKAIRCEEAQMLLDQYAHGELEPALAEAVSRHLANCRDCTAELEAVSATGASLRQALLEPPQVDLFPLIAERCRSRGCQTKARSSLGRWALSGLAAACALGLVILANWQATRTNPALQSRANRMQAKGSAAEQSRPYKVPGQNAAVPLNAKPNSPTSAAEGKQTGLPAENAHSRQEVLPNKHRPVERQNFLQEVLPNKHQLIERQNFSQEALADKRQSQNLPSSPKPKRAPLDLSNSSPSEKPLGVAEEGGADIPAPDQPELVLIAEPEVVGQVSAPERLPSYTIRFPESAFGFQPVRSLKVYTQDSPEEEAKVIEICFAPLNGAFSKTQNGKRGVQ